MTAHFVTAKSGLQTFHRLLLICCLVSVASCSSERDTSAGEETPELLGGAAPSSNVETPDTLVVTVPPVVDETPLEPIASTLDGTTDVNDEVRAEPLDLDALSTRLSNETCLAGEAPVEPVLLQRVFEGVNLRNPLGMEQSPGEENAPFYVAEKGGRIVAIPARDDATEVDATTVLQLDVHTDGESGVTALAFHPDYAINRRVFVGYGRQNEAGEITLRLSEFESSWDGLSFDKERVVLDIPKDNPLHFGGAIVFGPDGYLYMSVGDDGNNLDGDTHPEGAQDPNSVYGSILRIDVDDQSGTRRYGIPADNPDLTGNGPAEVWSYGFRNPWRMSFDRQAPHDLWASNVGSRETEEIDIVSAGSNHGWPMCEGPCDPRQVGLVDPVYSYSNKGGAAVIGGYLYRGTAVPELFGKYLFGDYVKQDVRVLDPSLLPNEPLYVQQLLTVPFRIASFAQDNAGELYVLAYSGGGVYRIERNPATEQGGPAARLSETGCFASLADGDPTPAPGVRDYTVSQKFWSDGASKRRQFALPDGKVIDTTDANDWQLPEGGLVIKHFYLQDRIIETRFLAHHEGGQYSGYTYEWNEALDDAKLVPSEGLVKTFGDLNWEYPSRGDCLRCHSEQAGHTLSLESRQLNVLLGNDEASQIDLLATAGYLDNDSPEKKKAYPTVEELTDPSISLEHRAKSWLHVNCSSCHQGRGSAGRAIWDARFKVPVAEKRLCDSKPFEAVGELPALEALVAPGAHEFSTTWLRASARGTSIAMPPISSSVVDKVGVALLAEWIDSLDGVCPPLGDRLPGRVQAQNYDNAFDLTPGNEGSSARCDTDDNVDLAETTDEDGSCVVGFTDPGEWVEYDVNVAEGGADTVTLRVASGKEPNGRPASIALRIDDETVAKKIEVPAKGWIDFQSIEVSGLDLSAGNHVIRLTFSTGFVNLNYFDVR